MGRDKSLIAFHGKPQREYLFDLMNTFCSKVYTSCKAGDDVPPALNPLPDALDIESPLNGILSGFKVSNDKAWLTVAIDMPNVNASILSYLINHRSANSIATCFYDSDGNEPEPLLTLWEPQAAPLLQGFYEQGKISPRDFLKQSKTTLLIVPDASALRNINSPDELNDYFNKK